MRIRGYVENPRFAVTHFLRFLAFRESWKKFERTMLFKREPLWICRAKFVTGTKYAAGHRNTHVLYTTHKYRNGAAKALPHPTLDDLQVTRKRIAR